MFSTIWHTTIYDPIYNLLVFLIDILPGGDVGFAVIFATVIVKLILFPLSLSAVRTQMVIRKIQPKIQEIQKKFKEAREEQARKLLELYKKYNINPFASLLVFIIQIPIVVTLYLVFVREPFPTVNEDLLYMFVMLPEHVSMLFLGLIDMGNKSLVLAVLAGATQFVQIRYALPPVPPKKEGEESSMKDDLMRSMQLQMRYVLPVLMAVFAYIISAVVALYFITSNLFAIAQELYMRNTIKKKFENEEEETV